MSWGTDFKADIYLSRLTFTSVGQIEDKIEEYDKDIINYEAQIKMYAASTPKDITPEDDEPVGYISNHLFDLLEEYRDAVISSYKVGLYLDCVRENPGLLKDNES